MSPDADEAATADGLVTTLVFPVITYVPDLRL